MSGNNGDSELASATIFEVFWLKPNMFYNFAIPDLKVGAILKIHCVTSVSKKHLKSYIDEFSLRHNTRKNLTCERFDF